MKELELKYGCNPNQKPSKIYMHDGSELPIEILSGRPGYINFLDAFNSWQLVKEIKMNITSGLIGVTEDKETYELTPKFGWYINVDDSSEDELYEKLKECDQYMGIILRIQSVPDVLKRFSHIRFLELKFMGNVVIPEWMDDIAIDIFIISGKMSSKEKSEIRKRFPNCEFD